MVTDNREVIGDNAVSYLINLLWEFSATPSDNYFSDILPRINEHNNEMLSQIVRKLGILFSVSLKTPRPTWVYGVILYSFLNIIGEDINEAVQLFFRGFGLPKAISATVLTLISKVKNATSLEKVRPINLCNFLHKIISKVLNDRIRPFLDKWISSEQFGFVPCRSFLDCIALAHELLLISTRRSMEKT